MRTKLNIVMLLALLIMLISCDWFNNANEDDRIIINNNAADLSTRVELKDEHLPLNGFDGAFLAKSSVEDSSSFVLVLRAEVAAPVYEGKTLRASHVVIENDYAYVSYNYEGEDYLGGIDVFDVSDIQNPQLISQAILVDTDISALSYKNGAIYLAEAQNPYLHDELQSPAIIEKMTLSGGLLSTQMIKTDLSSYVTTNLDVSTDKVYASTGSDGRIFVLDPSDLTVLDTIGNDYNNLAIAVADDKLISVRSNEFTEVWCKDLNSGLTTWGHGYPKNLPDSKAVVEIDDNYAYISMNDQGLKIIDIQTGTLVAELNRPETPEGASDIDYVTNAVSINDELLLIANGASGVWVGNKYSGDVIEIFGTMDFKSSTNFVEGKDDVIFVATGFGGFKIIEVQRYMPEEGDYLTLGAWDDMGLPYYLESEKDSTDDSLHEDIHAALPWTESAPDHSPEFFEDVETNLIMTEDAAVYVSYIFESAGLKNSLGFYTFDPENPPESPDDISDMTIIFPNTSMKGSGGSLEEGHTVCLGDFTEGTGIGFFLISNGWNNGDVSKGLYTHFTHVDINPEEDPNIRQHTVLLKDLKRDILVMGFEDISRKYASCDQDFDDTVFLIRSVPKNAYQTNDMPDLGSASSESKSGKQNLTILGDMKEWTPWFNSGYSEDNSVFVSGDHSGRLAINGTLSGARLIQGPTDISHKTIRIRFRAENWRALSEFSIRFYTDEESIKGYVLNILNYFATPNDGEWYDIIFPRSAFEAVGGVPDWSTVRNIYIRANSKANTEIFIDEIQLVDDITSRGIVTLSFDDGYDDVFVEGASYMDKYGFAGTAFIMPDQINEGDFMTEAQLDKLNKLGWGIGGHHISNLRKLSLDQVETVISSTKNWLIKRNYSGIDHFAYPNGSYNCDIQAIVLKYFSTARTIDGFNQPFGFTIDGNINSRTISYTTSVSELKSQIDEAVENNEWLILNFHKLVELARDDVEYNISDFHEIVDYLHDKDVTVIPYHTVIQDFCMK